MDTGRKDHKARDNPTGFSGVRRQKHFTTGAVVSIIPVTPDEHAWGCDLLNTHGFAGMVGES